MARVGDHLLIHADSTMYSSYGSSIAEVNQAFKALLHGDDAAAWDRLLSQFSERKAFIDENAEGAARAAQFLRDFGGRQNIPRPPPLSFIRPCPPAAATE